MKHILLLILLALSSIAHAQKLANADGSNITVPGSWPTWNQSTTGSAATLTTGRTLGITGDLTWTSPSFNGSANVTAAGTLANTAVTPGTYTNATVTVDAKGRITAASGLKHDGLFSDSEITGCTLDLDASVMTFADAASVTTVTDATGNVTFTSASTCYPVFRKNGLNGLPSLQFDGSNDYLTASSFFDTTSHAAITCFIVAQSTVSPNLATNIPQLINGTWPNFRVQFPSSGGTGYNYCINQYSNNLQSIPIALGDELAPVVFAFAQSASVSRALIGDKINQDNNYNAAASGAVGSLWLGKNSVSTANWYFTGHLSRLIIFNRALETWEILKIQRGLMARYSLQKRSITLDGDSLTVAVASAANKSLPSKTADAFPNWDISAPALGGRTSSERYATFQKTAQFKRDGDEIICYLIGTNDINPNGSAGIAGLQSNLQSYCALARANGKRIVVGTLPSMVPSSGKDQDVQRGVYNTWLRANWKTFADGLADYSAIPEIGDLGAYANTTYFLADGIHPVGPGYDLMGPVLVNAIKEMIGEPITPRLIASGTATILPTDSTIVVTGTTGATLNLPLATTVRTNKMFTAKDGGGNAGTNNITIVGTIDGATNKVISTNRAAVTLFSDGTNWLTR